MDLLFQEKSAIERNKGEPRVLPRRPRALAKHLSEFTINESELSLASVSLSRSLEGRRKARGSERSGLSQRQARSPAAPGSTHFPLDCGSSGSSHLGTFLKGRQEEPCYSRPRWITSDLCHPSQLLACRVSKKNMVG